MFECVRLPLEFTNVGIYFYFKKCKTKKVIFYLYFLEQKAFGLLLEKFFLPNFFFTKIQKLHQSDPWLAGLTPMSKTNLLIDLESTSFVCFVLEIY